MIEGLKELLWTGTKTGLGVRIEGSSIISCMR